VARFDKTEPHVGSFRAKLNAQWLLADVGRVRAVSLNANGRVVRGNPAGSTGLRGLIALGLQRNAGHPVDVMTSGEILDITAADIAGTLVAGAPVYATNTTGAGTLTMTAGAGVSVVGFLVEIDRLIVRMPTYTTAGA
jgi:hypothetical protein